MHFASLSVLPVTIGDAGSAVCPSGGATACARPISSGLFSLKGMAADSAWTPAALAAGRSSAGPAAG
jgi:hypothetical protein